MINSIFKSILIITLIANTFLLYGQNKVPSPLMVGASKVEITPSSSELPESFLGVHDKIYARAIVVKNEFTTVALVSVEVGALNDVLAESVLGKIEALTGIAKQNIMLTATHTHSVPFGMRGEAFESKIASSVKLALDKLVPAKIGYGEGVSYININRNIIDPKTRRWWEGPNYDAPADKTVGVVSFETLEGKPIAVYYNYAMHAVISGMFDMVSGDVPGAASRYIEDSYDDEIIALWSTGACGDINPIYYQQTYDLREIRVKEYAQRGQDISNKMPPGGTGLDRANPKVAKLMAQQKQMLLSMGQFLGEEVMHVMRSTHRKVNSSKIYVNRSIVSCPGRKRLDEGRAGYPGVYEDGDTQQLKLGLVVIGDIAMTSVNGEVFNPISTRLKKESPYANTMMLTLTNGYTRAGYIPHDAAFGTYTFEVLSSRLKPGCAEDAIVNGLLDMLYDSLGKK
jgi:neutral ceramidase